MKRCLALLICLNVVSLGAQQPSPPVSPQVPPAATGPAPLAADPLEVGGQAINVRLDVSVIDQIGDGKPQPRSLMVMLVDRAMGRTRAAFEDRTISVDARPIVMDGRVRMSLTIVSSNAAPRMTKMDAQAHDYTLEWRNLFSLLLESGKPVTALETVDPVTKRRLAIEVKATIQK